jgi:plastocyanin
MTKSAKPDASARARLGAAAAIGVATVALIGCTSSSPTSPPPASPTLTTAASHEAGTSTAPSITATSSGVGNVGSSASSGAAHAAASITIKNFAYRVTGTVRPGATVSVTNDDSTTHTVTADSGHGFDVTVEPGKTAMFTAPHTPGSYKFHCDFHADMHGTITVT